MDREKWDDRWLGLAQHIGTWSKDRSRSVGCVIVGTSNQILSTGYNGFPRGVDDTVPQRHERPEKYAWTEHAERNAIYNAARSGVSLDGASMYIPWFPCAACARAIVQAGLSELVAVPQDEKPEPQWEHEFQVSKLLLEEGGVAVRLRTFVAKM